MRASLVALAIVIALTPLAARRSLADKAGKFKPERVALEDVSLMLSPSGNVALWLPVENRTSESLWIRMTVHGGDAVLCEKSSPISANAQTFLACDADSIMPDTDYRVTVAIYPDSGMTTAAERGDVHTRFRKKDLEELQELVTAMTLPQVYENIICKEKLGLTTGMLEFGQSAGTLAISSDAIEWKSKKQTLTVPVAQVRGIEMKRAGAKGNDRWVVVEYEADGVAKILALQPNVFRRGGQNLHQLILASLQSAAKTE